MSVPQLARRAGLSETGVIGFCAKSSFRDPVLLPRTAVGVLAPAPSALPQPMELSVK